MESSSQDRNLPATERKLQQARDDGQTSRSKDLSHFLVLGSGALGLMALAPTLFQRLKLALSQQLSFNAASIAAPTDMLVRLQDMATVGLLAALAFALLVAVAVTVGEIAAGGWVTSLKPITPDLNRLNPISGLGNLFSKQQFVNVMKLMLIAGILGWTGWHYLSSSFQEVAAMMMLPGAAALDHLTQWLVHGLALLMLVVFVAAIVDVPLQTYFFKSRLKMSREEIKQEHKESDGNPEVKGKLRQRQREIAQRKSITQVHKADFVVMNPTHYAVALKYDEKTMHAPQVIAKGADLLAMRIREVAKTHSVPVLQSPMLARALYAHAELDQAIPSSLYAAVAQVLAYVYRLKMAMRGDGPMPPDMPEPPVPPELDPHHKKTSTEGAA